MVLIITPALDGLKREWREAAAILGASSWQYWRYVALPVLWPSLLGTTLLLFANAFGAIATAYALTGSSLNIVPILLYAQIRGDVLHDPNLGYALALGMIVITGALQRRLYLAARAQRAVAAMKQPALGAWIAFVVGTLYFFVPLIGTFEFSLRMRRGVYSFDAYRVVLADPRFQATFGYSTVHGAGDHRRRRAARRADRLLDPAAPAAAAAGRRVHHAAAAGHSGHRHRVRLSPPLQHARRCCR